MHISGVDLFFWLAAFLCEILLACILLVRGEYRRFPVFVAWICFLVIADPTVFWISRLASPSVYYQASGIASVLDSLFQLGVLIEIAYAVLKPAQRSLPRGLLVGMAFVLLIGFVGTLVWTLDQSQQSKIFQLVYVRLLQINFSFAYLRLGLFAAITGCSQMLGITWKNHVIRLAAGLAFFSAVSVMVELTLAHLPHSNHHTYEMNYSLLSRTQVIAYLCALSFWVWSFLRKDAPRREFTPQMERILVTISQTVRRDRVSLTRGLGHK
jgi:hypothetical protein